MRQHAIANMRLHYVLLTVLSITRLAVAIGRPSSSDPITSTAQGWLRGVRTSGNDGVTYDAFYGIPFAQPPLGRLRFANPQPPLSWSGIRNATTPASDCIQKNSLLPNPTVSGEEDCLYLNLYRPIRSDVDHARLPLPVIVYIHGGAFFAGSPSPYIVGPQRFMATGRVLMVTIAYRLGALGFLSTGDSEAPGNFGLKDQSMALSWVQQNAVHFGGDPNRVTLMGVSAGAASVHLHMMSPRSKGLFQRAISLSGNALGPYNNPADDPFALALRQARVLGIRRQPLSSRDLVDQMRALPAAQIVDSVDELKFWSVDPLTLYRLVVEPQDSEGAFLTASPTEISTMGSYAPRPWIQSTVQNEGVIRAGSILSNRTLLADLNDRLDELLPQLMELKENDSNSLATISEKIRRRYLNGAGTITQTNQQGFIDMYSDRSFLYPLYKATFDFVRTADPETPVYVHRFNFHGPYSYSTLLTQTDYGVSHMDDTIYLFESAFLPPFAPSSASAHISRTLVQYYVDFAESGHPTNLGEVRPCTRETINRDSFCEYYSFANSNSSAGYAVSVDNYFDIAMIDFWDDILGVSEPDFN